jgi:hypothetical protein
VLWATRRWYRNDPAMHRKVDAILKDLVKEFGPASKLAASLGGRLVFKKLRAEAEKPSTESAEPPTFYERSAGCAVPVS